MLHNEEVYSDPFTFNPDRFMKDGKLDKSIRDPAHACWGFGRRLALIFFVVNVEVKIINFSICPGRYMAFSAVWIAIASVLTVFDLKKAVDEEGNVIELSHEYLSALVW